MSKRRQNLLDDSLAQTMSVPSQPVSKNRSLSLGFFAPPTANRGFGKLTPECRQKSVKAELMSTWYNSALIFLFTG